MTKVRVNIRSLANTSAVRSEKRNGREVLIVPSATLPDDVVMNGVMYPADEIEKSYMSLNRSPAPAGHPLINGEFVSARDPEGINIGWVGAWNENVRRENGRVLLDKVIDVERANQSEAGKAILNAVDKGDPVHTSTGLYCLLEAANGDVEYANIARSIEFDHDAILIGEQGAATPEQGVGMLVNAKGEREEIEVINSTLEDADRELDWAVDHLARALERREAAEMRAPVLERIKTAVKEAFLPSREQPKPHGKDFIMDKEQFDALSEKVDALTEANDKIGETITNAVTEALKPVVEAQAEITANAKAEAEAAHTALVNKVVEANIDGFTEEVAQKMDATALNALLSMKNAAPKKAAPLVGGFVGNAGDNVEDFSPLAAKGA